MSGSPEMAPPVTVGLTKYEQRVGYPGYLFAVSAKNGELLYVKQVKPARISSTKPFEPQLTYFRTMKLAADQKSLELEGAQGAMERFALLEKERGSDWPAWVSLVKRGPKSLVVKLTIPNFGKKPLKLDGPSVAEGGQLRNAVFALKADGKPLEYQGMMAKRAPPDEKDFIRVAPGASYSVEVELAQEYPLPSGGAVTVSFATFNHFSSDEVSFTSNELVVE